VLRAAAAALKGTNSCINAAGRVLRLSGTSTPSPAIGLAYTTHTPDTPTPLHVLPCLAYAF
jgi:hypothetical protein